MSKTFGEPPIYKHKQNIQYNVITITLILVCMLILYYKSTINIINEYIY